MHHLAPEHRGHGVARRVGRWLMWRAGIVVGGSVAVALSIGFAANQLQRLVPGIPAVQLPPPVAVSEVRTDVGPLVLQQLRLKSELTTATQAGIQNITKGQATLWVGQEVARTSVIREVSVEVRAGVDLSQLTAAHISQVGSELRVTLPPPRILSVERQGRTLHHDPGFLNLGPDVQGQLQDAADAEGEQKFVTATCSALLREASEKAAQEVQRLLSLVPEVTDHALTVTVQTSPPTGDSCKISP
jgi:hypothetical protein